MPLPLTFFSFVFMEHRNFLESGELSVIYVGHGIGITSPPGRIPKSISSAGTHVLKNGSLPDAPCTIQHRKTVHLDLGRWTSFGHFHSDPIPVSSIVTLSLPRKNPNSLLGTQEANNLAVLLCLTQQPQSNTTNNINTNLLILQSVYVLLPTISMLIRQTNYRNFSACMKLRENLCTCSCINHMAGAPITIHHTLLLHPTTKINTLSGLVSNLYRSTQSTL
ncbi:uncharacterized protein LOC113317611 isoform X2 [Papaver somniferum]|uniref:uncharacterized protein LOC113317611 isoform X2 n=1 Tax=Papaver somniferum TaxID=3469 RepID=UPI000E6FE7BA|nr:uncharacterized protein LOC113317611 isoform X2 [Papaver somniferum]